MIMVLHSCRVRSIARGDDDKVKFYPLASKLCFRQLVLVARSDRAKRFHLSEVAHIMQQFL